MANGRLLFLALRHVCVGVPVTLCVHFCLHLGKMDSLLFYVVYYFSRGELEFSHTLDLKNPWNDSKPVKISRDGQASV